VGIDGKVLGIDRFGLSAPGDQVMKELGISTEQLVKVAKSVLA
jgi:transketolase